MLRGGVLHVIVQTVLPSLAWTSLETDALAGGQAHRPRVLELLLAEANGEGSNPCNRQRY